MSQRTAELTCRAGLLCARIVYRGVVLRSSLLTVRMQRADFVRILIMEMDFDRTTEICGRIQEGLESFFSRHRDVDQQIENELHLNKSSLTRLIPNQKIRQFFLGAAERELLLAISDIKTLLLTLQELYDHIKQTYPDEIGRIAEIGSSVLDFQSQIDQCCAMFEEMMKKHAIKWSIGKGVVAGVVAGGVAVAATPVVLGFAGFGSAGVVGGSLAASIQSAVYGGATAGVFSTCQSVGVAGLSWLTITAVPATTAAVGGAVGAAHAQISSARENNEAEMALPEVAVPC